MATAGAGQLLLLTLLCALPAAADPAGPSQQRAVLWYTHPAADWESEALPIGNGALGAMVMGGIDTDILQFNEKTLWTGGPGARAGYHWGIPVASKAGAVAGIVARIDREHGIEPTEVAAALGAPPQGYGDYQSFGALRIEYEAAPGAVDHYRRELDLDQAVAAVSYSLGDAHVRREYLVSHADGVLALRVSADQPGRIGLDVHVDLPPNRRSSVRAQGGTISVDGALEDNELRFAATVRIANEGGIREALADGGVRVRAANAVTLWLAAGTDHALRYPRYRGAAPAGAVRRRVADAAARGYAAVLARHVADYRALHARTDLRLADAGSPLPTDELRRAYGHGDAAADRALEALYFQYGRYLLISSSRGGTLPANLQGLWNQSATPPWNADYHLNINLQMNYWPAEADNLAETTAPLFDFIDALIPPGTVAARRMFAAPGWTAFLNTNAWGYAGPIAWPTAFWQPEAAAWLAQHYYEHYLYSLDPRFLRQRAWPVMRGAAQFWLATLHRDPDSGRLLVSPSYSPEHGPFTAGAAMSQQIVAALLEEVAALGARMGEPQLGARAAKAMQQLDRGLHVGQWGQLQEWQADLDRRDDDHRHVSQLYALFPGDAISPWSTPQLAQAARTTLDARGDATTGWSRAWKLNLWARLLDGDRAHRLLAGLLSESTLPNLFDTHPPFQIDGNLGAIAGMTEMLLQSQGGVIHVLPALPRAWPAGEVRGLRARGDAQLDIRWADGEASAVIIRTGHAGTLTLATPLLVDGQFTDVLAGTPVACDRAGGQCRFTARAGGVYLLRKVTGQAAARLH